MLQAVMYEPGKITYNEVDEPRPGIDEVLLKMKKIGVCGSDIHVYNGLHPYTSYPVIQGHEASGEIIETGKNVTGFSPGDKVTFMPQVTCGKCYPCRHGMYHICDNLKVMGFQTEGVAQEFAVIPSDKLIKLPDTMSFDEGAMIEPLAVAVHALKRSGESISGKKVLVMGSGTIGNLVGQTAKALGAKAVMIVDLSDFRLEKAKECGIEYTVNSEKESLKDSISDNFGPDKADIILECAGAEPTITMSVDNARKGTTIVVVGVFGKKPVVDLGLVQDRELSLIGTLMYQKNDYETAVALVKKGKIALKSLITDTYPFKSYLAAYKYINKTKDRALKVMIKIS